MPPGHNTPDELAEGHQPAGTRGWGQWQGGALTRPGRGNVTAGSSDAVFIWRGNVAEWHHYAPLTRTTTPLPPATLLGTSVTVLPPSHSLLDWEHTNTIQ